jgi:hexokinase
MADVPKDLLAEINKLEEQFTVDTAKLKAITKHFVDELTKGRPPYFSVMIFADTFIGLTVEGGSIVRR